MPEIDLNDPLLWAARLCIQVGETPLKAAVRSRLASLKDELAGEQTGASDKALAMDATARAAFEARFPEAALITENTMGVPLRRRAKELTTAERKDFDERFPDAARIGEA
jgi:hypothetical protein